MNGSKNGKTWFPNVDVSKWWDSGNTGANTAGAKIILLLLKKVL